MPLALRKEGFRRGKKKETTKDTEWIFYLRKCHEHRPNAKMLLSAVELN